MRDEQHRLALAPPDPPQLVLQDAARLRVEGAEGLVHQQDVGTAGQRLRERDDLPFIGLIGSKSKWGSFRHRLEDRGFGAAEIERITCPIGVPGVVGKEPEVIAAAVAALLLWTGRGSL